MSTNSDPVTSTVKRATGAARKPEMSTSAPFGQRVFFIDLDSGELLMSTDVRGIVVPPR